MSPTALDQALEAIDRVYAADRALMVWRTQIMWRDGGPDPLDQVPVFVDPRGFLTYVGLGLTELEEKRSPNPSVSGFGFELTLRYAFDVPADIDLEAPDAVERNFDRLTGLMPFWPVDVLNRLARYVYDSKRPLVHTDFMHLRGAPFHEYLGFIDDRELGKVDTVNGQFAFRQVVPLADAETLERLAAAGTDEAALAMFDGWRAADPHLCWHVHHGPPAAPPTPPPPEQGRAGWLRRLLQRK